MIRESIGKLRNQISNLKNDKIELKRHVSRLQKSYWKILEPETGADIKDKNKTIRILKKIIRELEVRLKAAELIAPDGSLPFQKLHGNQEIATACRRGTRWLSNHLPAMREAGCVWYEHTGRNFIRRNVSYPYLLMLYFKERGLQEVYRKNDGRKKQPYHPRNNRTK